MGKTTGPRVARCCCPCLAGALVEEDAAGVVPVACEVGVAADIGLLDAGVVTSDCPVVASA